MVSRQFLFLLCTAIAEEMVVFDRSGLQDGQHPLSSQLDFWSDLYPTILPKLPFSAEDMNKASSNRLRKIASMQVKFMNIINFFLRGRSRTTSEPNFESSYESQATANCSLFSYASGTDVREKGTFSGRKRLGFKRRIVTKWRLVKLPVTTQYSKLELVVGQCNPCSMFRVPLNRMKERSRIRDIFGKWFTNVTTEESRTFETDLKGVPNCNGKWYNFKQIGDRCPLLNFKMDRTGRFLRMSSSGDASFCKRRMSKTTDSTSSNFSSDRSPHALFSLFNFLSGSPSSGERTTARGAYMRKKDRNYWDWKNRVFVSRFKAPFKDRSETERPSMERDTKQFSKTQSRSCYRLKSGEIFSLFPNSLKTCVPSSTSNDEYLPPIKKPFSEVGNERTDKRVRTRKFNSREKATIKELLLSKASHETIITCFRGAEVGVNTGMEPGLK